VVAAATADKVARDLGDTQALTRAVLVKRLAERGIAAAAMLEVDAVLAQPELRARQSVYHASNDGGAAPVFVAPFGLTGTPVKRGERVGRIGEDNAAFVNCPAAGNANAPSAQPEAAKAATPENRAITLTNQT
jgi:crotonobetainyl-CoA:carnitine CoA-transferase CaiB-like acyl-CoA transferase